MRICPRCSTRSRGLRRRDLFECERRGTSRPSSVLDHPEVVELHRFVHAGSNWSAFTTTATGRSCGSSARRSSSAHRRPCPSRRGQADRTCWRHCTRYERRPRPARGPRRVRGAGGVGGRGRGGHDHRRDVQLAGRGAAGPGGDQGGRPAGGGDLRRAPGRNTARRGQPGGRLPSGGAGRRHRRRPQLHPRAAHHAADARLSEHCAARTPAIRCVFGATMTGMSGPGRAATGSDSFNLARGSEARSRGSTCSPAAPSTAPRLTKEQSLDRNGSRGPQRLLGRHRHRQRGRRVARRAGHRARIAVTDRVPGSGARDRPNGWTAARTATEAPRLTPDKVKSGSRASRSVASDATMSRP